MTYTANEFRPILKPVWCPGCGDFAVLNSVHRALAAAGCSSRLPGYVETYGLNSPHGRALPIATGAKLAAPRMTVVAVGGDGLAIGGNHFLQASRRNVDIAYFMMDNEIYGLTKGQDGPTTPTGDRTKSTTYGNPNPSIDPCALAIACGASWVGRGFSGDVKGMTELMTRAIQNHGFAFLNILSPCVTWRGEEQHKEIRAKTRPVPAGHDATSREAAMRFTVEGEHVTGVLYEVQRPTLRDERSDIERRARGNGPPPSRADFLGAFAL
ncbi:MAG TPA: 2-oxoacid:ferredoxin oxidoreductase subunit beta [Thermoanaerobaculia bacterium]